MARHGVMDEQGTSGAGISGEEESIRRAEPESHGPEWQPWDFGAKALLIMAVITVLALIAVFVNLALPH